MVALPSEAIQVEDKLRIESKRIRFRNALHMNNRVRHLSEFGVFPTASAPAYHSVQANDGTWSYTGPSGNNTAALINAAYQRGIAEGFSLAFDFTPGQNHSYWLEQSLLCMSLNGGGTAYQTVDLPALIGGAGFKSVAGQQRSNLVATHANPVVITQGGRGFTMRNLWLSTQYFSNMFSTAYNSASHAERFNDHTLWNHPNLRHSQWSPSCCIAVDPFGSLPPSNDQYPGLETYYAINPAFSSAVTIEDCSFVSNRVAVLLGNGVNANTDGITVRNCSYSKVKYCVVTCHAQTKNVLVDRPTIAEVWSVLGNSVHGPKNGIWPGLTNPANCSYIANIYGGDGLNDVIHPDAPVAFVGNTTTWEDVGRIGYFGASGGATSPVSISDLHIAFRHTGQPHFKSGRQTKIASSKWIMNDAPGERIWVEPQCVDDMPSTWDSGFQGYIRGAQTTFDDVSFAVSGSSATTLGGLLTFGAFNGAGNVGKRNWYKFENCKGYCGDFNNLYQTMVNNIRGGALT